MASKAYYDMEVHYSKAWGGIRPGNDGGVNRFSGDSEGTPDVVGALGGNADIECKLRKTIPAFLKKAVGGAVAVAHKDHLPIVQLFRCGWQSDIASQFVIVRRQDFDKFLRPQIVNYGSLARAVSREHEAARVTEIVIFHKGGAKQTFQQVEDDEPGKVNEGARIEYIVDSIARICLYSRRTMPGYLLGWRDQITKHTSKNGRLPIIVLHEKGKVYGKSDLVIIPRADFENWFGKDALHAGCIKHVAAKRKADPEIDTVRLSFDNGNTKTLREV